MKHAASAAILLAAARGFACGSCPGFEAPFPESALADGATFSDGSAAFAIVAPSGYTACWHPVVIRSLDGGSSWEGPRAIESDCQFGVSAMGMFPGGASGGDGRLYAAWFATPGGTGGPVNLVARTSPDRGTTWPGSPLLVATLTLPFFGNAQTAQVRALPGGRAWVLWRDGLDVSSRRYYLSATADAGATWSLPVWVDDGLADPAVSLQLETGEDGLVYLLALTRSASAGDHLRLRRSLDSGLRFSPWTLVDDFTVPASVSGPRLLALEAGKTLVTWKAGRDVFARLSLDGGASFTLPVARIDTGDAPEASDSGAPEVLRSGPAGALSAVWIDWRDTDPRVYASASSDDGRSWSAPFALSVASGQRPVLLPPAGHPGESRVRVLWREGARALTAVSCDGGASFGAAEDAGIANLGGGLHLLFGHQDGADSVIWHDTRDFRVRRFDPPLRPAASSATTYCAGSDPTLVVPALSAGCPQYVLQWYVDGLAVPGATTGAYTPSLAPGMHTVEARATCPLAPRCVPDALAIALQVSAPAPAAAVGNRLRAVRVAGGVSLTWPGATLAGDEHFHLTRAIGKGGPGSLLTPDPAFRASGHVDPAPPVPLALYDLRRAQACEVESPDLR